MQENENAPTREQELKIIVEETLNMLGAKEVVYSELDGILRAIDFYFSKRAKL